MQDRTPPDSAAEGIKQAERHGYSVPPLATMLAEEREVTKKEFSQLQNYFKENPWVKLPDLPTKPDGSQSKPGQSG